MRASTARRTVALAAVALAAPFLAGCGSSVQSFEVGECVVLADQPATITNLPKVDCAEEHDGEVFHVHTFEDGDFPGAVQVADELGAACTEAFEPYVGTEYSRSAYSVQILQPTADGWDRADHRAGTCVLHTPGEMRTDSARDSGR